jgi:hypothetical protein
MAELAWITSEFTQEHPQKLVSQGYIMTVELSTYHVPEDPRPLLR